MVLNSGESTAILNTVGYEYLYLLDPGSRPEFCACYCMLNADLTGNVVVIFNLVFSLRCGGDI